MEEDKKPLTLRRWSERKLAVAREQKARDASAPGTLAAAPVASPPAAIPPDSGTRSTATEAATSEALPPVESLTFESDFTAFLSPKVEQGLKRQALRKLFSDPRFNVMDGLDVYIDDYSIPSPLEPEVAMQLAHARYIFDPPQTRLTADGHVEDVPPAEDSAAAEQEGGAAPRLEESRAATATPIVEPLRDDDGTVSSIVEDDARVSGAAEYPARS